MFVDRHLKTYSLGNMLFIPKPRRPGRKSYNTLAAMIGGSMCKVTKIPGRPSDSGTNYTLGKL